ncbi:MAG: 30S ribosomal protein S2 [Candidatus Dormibacteria bacterium]
MPQVNLRQLLEAGVHFGHQTSRWNPKMRPFIFTARSGVHIIDLQQTVDLLEEACNFVGSVVQQGRPVLFVGTKKQAQETIELEANRAQMPYVNHRWMGGMLTNFQTIQKRIKRLHEIRKMRDEGQLEQISKKMAARHLDELDQLESNFRGIAEMRRLPGAVFVIDPRKEHIAVSEARRLGIPIVALTDSNCDPDPIDYVIPGNDDAIRAVKLVAGRIAQACLEARQVVAAAELAPEPVWIEQVAEIPVVGADLAEQEELVREALATPVVPGEDLPVETAAAPAEPVAANGEEAG